MSDRLIGPGRLSEENTVGKPRSFRPTTLSPLDDRLALSQVGLAPAALLHQVRQSVVPEAGHELALNGTISGTFVTTPSPVSNAVAGFTTTFVGSGPITDLGQVEVTGTLETPASASGPRSRVETFNLTTAQGSVTLRVNDFAGSPATAQPSFSIVKATGVFAGDTGTGAADLQFIREAIPVVPPGVTRGIFALTLHSVPPIGHPISV